jgi:SPRY domain-containing protein
MIPGLRTPDGVLYTTAGPPPADTPFLGGVALSDDGQVYTTTSTVGAIFVNGFMVSPLGELVIAAVGVPNVFNGGVGILASGAVLSVTSAPAVTDPVSGNQRLRAVDGALYATLDPVGGGGEPGEVVTFDPTNKGLSVSLSNGNLTAECWGIAGVKATVSRSATENRFFEVTFDSLASFGPLFGVSTASGAVAGGIGYPGRDQFGYGYWRFNGRKYNNAIETVYGASWNPGDVIGVHLNNGDLTFYKNGVSQGVAFSGLSVAFFPHVGSGDNAHQVMTANFGASPFAFAKPVGSTSWDGNQ